MLDRRGGLFQELQPLGAEFDPKRRKARYVAAGMRKTPDETGRYRIRTDPADNRDCACGFLSDDYGWAVGEDDINGQADQLFGHPRQLKSPAESRYLILI